MKCLYCAPSSFLKNSFEMKNSHKLSSPLKQDMVEYLIHRCNYSLDVKSFGDVGELGCDSGIMAQQLIFEIREQLGEQYVIETERDLGKVCGVVERLFPVDQISGGLRSTVNLVRVSIFNNYCDSQGDAGAFERVMFEKAENMDENYLCFLSEWLDGLIWEIECFESGEGEEDIELGDLLTNSTNIGFWVSPILKSSEIAEKNGVIEMLQVTEIREKFEWVCKELRRLMECEDQAES